MHAQSSLFLENSAGSGGAVQTHNSQCILKDSLFIGNTAVQLGGAMYLDEQTNVVAMKIQVFFAVLCFFAPE